MQYWEPGTFYSEGSVVEYEGLATLVFNVYHADRSSGHKYKIIQPHTSQASHLELVAAVHGVTIQYAV
jgi:hypothetical protein